MGFEVSKRINLTSLYSNFVLLSKLPPHILLKCAKFNKSQHTIWHHYVCWYAVIMNVTPIQGTLAALTYICRRIYIHNSATEVSYRIMFSTLSSFLYLTRGFVAWLHGFEMNANHRQKLIETIEIKKNN